MSKATFLRFLAIFWFATSIVSAQHANIDLAQKLPVDSKITIGKLKNGLTYYIRENKKPENRAELRLAVNAGSILEDDDQQGLAHFVEHMAFNGTKHFAKHEIIDYLESIGMRFGPDINAYTSFDETVYMLQVPTDSAKIVETGLQILTEWAHNLAFEDEEIDKERGVVIEEWRLGRGASARMRDEQFPILLKDSRYAKRLPIGKKKILEQAPYDALKRFYRDWYRPDLMAVVAIGDFDKNWIEGLIKKYFSRIKGPEHKRERRSYPVPDHRETLFALASDPEATNTSISMYYKQDLGEEGTAGAYRESLVEALYNGMLNDRLDELRRKAEPPLLAGFSSKVSFIRTKKFYVLGATVREDGIEKGLEAVLTEAQRVKQFGFTQTELERQKTEMLRAMERAYNERDKTESSTYAAEYIRNFLTDESLPGIEYEFEMYKQFLPAITLHEVNKLVGKWITEENRVVMQNGPEKDGVQLPTESDLQAVFARVDRLRLSPYEDKVPDLPLVQTLPTPGAVTEEKHIDDIDVTEWRLSNGIRVVLKPTEFKNDEILFLAFSPGGHSLIPDANYIPAMSATSIIREGGLGSFDHTALQKKLTGKLVAVSPFISELQEGFSGSVSPQDLETAFQLIYLYFTAPRRDSTAFESFKKRIIGFIENRHASPEAAYLDTIQVTMSRYHFRARPWSEEVLQEMDLEKSFRIYQDRFADASDFTFLFVGNFEIATMKPLVEKYLGGLHPLNRQETWRDVGMRPPKGVVQKELHRGLEPKSRVSLIFTGPFKWNRKNRHMLISMANTFRIKLREIMREDKGGTYGVRVSPSTSHYPNEEYSLNISFGCDPERVDELTRTVFEQIDSLKTFGTTNKYLKKVKETQIRSRETDLQENGFWLRALRSVYYHESDPKNILTYDKLVESLTLADIKKAARKYFNTENYVEVVLYPEDR
ncbi:MAG: insulinase family protein [Caldithrix sp.]|nr:MAG: insulinase family protein [Caldithrix sp.]